MEHHASFRASIGALVIAIVMTTAFHFLFAEHPMYLGLSAFLVATLLIVLLGSIFVVPGPKNKWALLFIIPVVFSAIGIGLYRQDAIQMLGFLFGWASLFLFTFWYIKPVSPWRSIKTLWPAHLWLNTCFPFPKLRHWFEGSGKGKTLGRIALGLVIAIPILAIVAGLFISADEIFASAIHEWLQPKTLMRLTRDGIVGIFFLGFAWTAIMRRLEPSQPKTESSREGWSDSVIFNTVLSALNALFALFIGFQIAALIGGAEFVRTHHLVYASYAREGFFQLIVVAGLVFGLGWLLYGIARDKMKLGTKVLFTVAVGQIALILLSAVRRLMLYIETYGWTVSRLWALTSLIIIALVLAGLLVAFWMKTSYEAWERTTAMAVLIGMSALLLINTSALVMRWNVDRFVQGRLKSVEVYYSQQDSIKEIERLFTMPWQPEWAFDGYRVMSVKFGGTATRAKADWKKFISYPEIRWADWRDETVSYFRAKAILEK